MKSTVSVNGKLSEWFPIQSGRIQGDPSSPDLFAMCDKIRQNKMTKGILVQGTETKFTQYAYDTELMLEGDI